MAAADVQVHEEIVRKVMGATQVDKDGLRSAYSQVRDDKVDITWAVFKYEGNQVVVSAKGSSFDEFKGHFADDERAFAYMRLQTGDELSRRVKFLMLTWVGSEVSAMKRAKMSTDKALIKEVLPNFAVELTVENSSEIDEDLFTRELTKAGGADYGTGIRE